MKKTPDKLRIIIDADPIVYRVGFASQSDVIEIVAQDEKSILQKRFERTDKKTARKLFAEWKEANPNFEVIDENVDVVAEPISFVLDATRAQINSIIKEIVEEYGKDHRDVYTHMVLSGEGNHRCELATIKKYKGNRDKKHKPVHYQAIRDLLMMEYGARLIDGREADDEVSIVAHASAKANDWNFVIATIDKDLDQIPGNHYDYMKKLHYGVDVSEARRWFWYQVLAGDGTDNIAGAYRVGKVKAASILKDMEKAYEVELYEKDMDYDDIAWKTVLEVYTASMKVAGCPYTDAEAAAIENARLVYLQKAPGELWTPPGQQMKQLITKELDD